MADVFLRRDICRIFHNKYVIFIGSSVERSMYKDFVKLLQGNVLLSDTELRKKGERCFQGDKLLEGGVLQGLSNGTQYREVREYRSDYVLVRFYFITRCYNDYVESIIVDFDKDPSPDMVVMNSALWDLTRYGDNSVPQFKSEIETVFNRLSSSLPSRCLFLWLTCLPVSEFAKGGIFIPEVEYLRNLTRLETQLADYHCAQLASSFGFDVLDLCYFFRDHLHRRALDGIHWDMTAHRRITNLILTHVSQAWGLPLPGMAVNTNTSENQPSFINKSKSLSEDSNEPQPLKESNRGEKRKLRKIKRRNLKLPSRTKDNANKDGIDFGNNCNFNLIDDNLDKENVEPFFKSCTKPAEHSNSSNPTLTNAALFQRIENIRRGVPDSMEKELTSDVDSLSMGPHKVWQRSEQPAVVEDEPYWVKPEILEDSNDPWEQGLYLEERNCSDNENNFPTPHIGYGVIGVKRDRSYSPPDTGNSNSDRTLSNSDFQFGKNSDHFREVLNFDPRFELKSPKRFEEAYERMENCRDFQRGKGLNIFDDRVTRFERRQESKTNIDLRHGLNNLSETASGNHRDEFQPRLSEFTVRSERLDFRSDVNDPLDCTDCFDRDDVIKRTRLRESSRTNYREDRHTNDNLNCHVKHSVRRLPNKFDDLKHRPNEQNVRYDNAPSTLTRSMNDRSLGRDYHSSPVMPLQENRTYGQRALERKQFNDVSQMHDRGISNTEGTPARGVHTSPGKTFNRYGPTRQDLNRSPTSYSGGIFESKRLGRQLPHGSPSHVDSLGRGRSFGSVVDDVMEAIHARNSMQSDKDQEWQRQNFNISVPKRIVFVVKNNSGWKSSTISKRGQGRSLSSAMRSRLKSIEIETSYPDDIPLADERGSDPYFHLGRDRSNDGNVWMDDYRR